MSCSCFILILLHNEEDDTIMKVKKIGKIAGAIIGTAVCRTLTPYEIWMLASISAIVGNSAKAGGKAAEKFS